jgi:hypothetical protein
MTAVMSAVSTGNSTAVSGEAVSSSRQEDNAVTSSSTVTVSSSPGKDKMVLSFTRFSCPVYGHLGLQAWSVGKFLKKYCAIGSGQLDLRFCPWLLLFKY